MKKKLVRLMPDAYLTDLSVMLARIEPVKRFKYANPKDEADEWTTEWEDERSVGGLPVPDLNLDELNSIVDKLSKADYRTIRDLTKSGSVVVDVCEGEDSDLRWTLRDALDAAGYDYPIEDPFKIPLKNSLRRVYAPEDILYAGTASKGCVVVEAKPKSFNVLGSSLIARLQSDLMGSYLSAIVRAADEMLLRAMHTIEPAMDDGSTVLFYGSISAAKSNTRVLPSRESSLIITVEELASAYGLFVSDSRRFSY